MKDKKLTTGLITDYTDCTDFILPAVFCVLYSVFFSVASVANIKFNKFIERAGKCLLHF